MVKRCLNCGNLVDVNAKFCQKCGASEFSQPLQQPGFNAYEGGSVINNAPQFQPVNVTPTETPKKKKMAPWQIILIVLVSVAVAILVYFFVSDLMDKNDNSSDNKEETKITEVTQQNGDNNNNADDNNIINDKQPIDFDVQYTKGGIVGSNYVNEWANISFSIRNYPEADQSMYSTYSNITTECGYISVNQTNGSSVMIMFEDVSSQGSTYTVYDYIDDLKNVVTVMYGSGVQLSSYSPSVEIAGEVYQTISLTHQSTGLNLRYHVRLLDNRAIVILASGFGESSIDSFINTITQCNSL